MYELALEDKTNLTDKELPRFVRQCWHRYREATKDLRDASQESLKMWLGGKHQWLAAEVAARMGKNRPLVTINRCKPVVDQIENECRQNPPGPQALPVGGGADKDGADILEGLIREYEYRSDAHNTAYAMALRYACAGNYGVFELATEYENERSFEQRLIVKQAEDPSMYFVDPAARGACREDAMWAGKVRVLTEDQLIEQYGTKPKVLNRGLLDAAAGWIQGAISWPGEQASINEWTGGVQRKGPYYVVDFYRVKIQSVKLVLYSDYISRFEDEIVPNGVTPKLDDDGKPLMRLVGRRLVKKYLVTALDVLDETDWYGDIIPYFWVMGPEIWIDRKLYRLSLIDGAIGSQRGLNYAATSAAEIVGLMTKAPWIGPQGSFDIQNAQGINPWLSSNTEVWAYLEYKPVMITDETTGQSHMCSPPERNSWEAPITRVLELATFFTEQLKAATSVFFDPTIQHVSDVQSGEAIKALQSQTNIGTMNWQDQLHRAVTLSYQQAAKILPKICDGPRVKAIVRPDTKHEMVEINREFSGDKNIVGSKKRNNITLGEYSLRVTAGPNFHTRTENSISVLTEVFRIVPGLLNNPSVTSQFLRMVGEGSPQVEQIADSIMPGTDEQTPEQLQAMIQQLKQQDQAKTQLLQKLQQTLMAKLPEIEAKKWVAAVQAIAGIREAEIKAGVDRAQQDLDTLEHITSMAHETGMQAADHEHEMNLQQTSPPPSPDQQTGDNNG